MQNMAAAILRKPDDTDRISTASGHQPGITKEHSASRNAHQSNFNHKESTMSTEVSFDAFPPPGMAAKAEGVGVKKAGLDFLTMFALAILAGAFIGVGAIFATTVLAGSSTLPYGVARLLGGLAFTTGLILVVVGGAELFTGNNLIIMAFASRKVSLGGLLRNWGLSTSATLSAQLPPPTSCS
jgi:hypothetical protein